MIDSVVFNDFISNIIVMKDNGNVYLWFNRMGEQSITFVMPEKYYIEMVNKMVDIANRSDDVHTS